MRPMNALSASGHAVARSIAGWSGLPWARFAAAVGTRRSGAVRGRDRWCAQAPLRGALPARGPGSASEASHQLDQRRFDRSRSDRIGRPSAMLRRAATERPPPGRPTRSPARRCHRTRSSRGTASSGSTARKPCAMPPGSTPSSAPSSMVSTTGRGPLPSSKGRTSTSATNARPLATTQWSTGGDGAEAAQHAGWRTSRGWPGRTARVAGAALAEAASLVGVALDRP